MSVINESRLRTAEIGLAFLVLLVMALTFTALPQPYPVWPTIVGIPVNPELLVPGLLSIVALLCAVRDGMRAGSIVAGILSVLTLYMAIMGFHALLFPEPSGGLFVEGFFSLIFGTALAIVVLARSVARQIGFKGISYWVRNRFDSM